MQSKNLLLAILALVLLGGCGGSPTPAPQAKEALPSWINAPLPSDTEESMYGMAIAEDRDSAIKAALSDMVAKLGTTIESSYESNEEVRGGFVNSSVKNKIKSDVSKVNINNYKVIESHRVSYREFAVMLQSDKNKFAQGLKESLDAEMKAISQKYDSLRELNSLSRYNAKKELSRRANELLPNVFIIASLDKKFNIKESLEFIKTKESEFLKEAKNLKFYFNGDAKSAKFISHIKNYLAQKGFNVSNSKNGVLVNAKTTDNINSGASIVVITLEISVYDMNQRIGGKTIILKERYNGSAESVYKNAAIHLEQDIKSEGINELIGINLSID